MRWPTMASDDTPTGGDVEALAEVFECDGPAPCVACKTLARKILASDWLAARVQAARAEAWDEGWAKGLRGSDGWDGVPVANPYRAAALRAAHDTPGGTS